MDMELRCECREPVVRASLANEDSDALSGIGGASLLPLFLLLPNNDLPPLDVRPDLSPEENMMARVYGERVGDVLRCRSGGDHAASGGQERCPVCLLLLPQSSPSTAAALTMNHVCFASQQRLRSHPVSSGWGNQVPAVRSPPPLSRARVRVCWSRVLCSFSNKLPSSVLGLVNEQPNESAMRCALYTSGICKVVAWMLP